MKALTDTHTKIEYTEYLRELRRERALSTLANNYHSSSFEAANNNKQVGPTLSARIYAFFDAWTQSSYEAWEKAGRPTRDEIKGKDKKEPVYGQDNRNTVWNYV